jgi:hypothetical protein
LFRPSEVYIETLAESDQEGLLGDKVRKLEQDFLDVIEELPTHKARIANYPESTRQDLIDFAFAFFIGGACAILDKHSKYNTDRSELEFRRDLN